MRKFWIDTDTASDDAVAIMMALRHPEIEVVGISIVAGNVPLAMGQRNARFTVELCGAQTPVYAGASKPLLRPLSDAYFFHGPDGMGGMNYPEASLPLRDEHGVEALIRAVRAAPGEITLVTLGPLTNVALAVALAPDIAAKLRACVVMGGAAIAIGNITPAAEFNIWVDPEAARMVFHSGAPLLMVGAELCRDDANLNDDDIARVRALGTPVAQVAIDCNLFALEANRTWFKEAGMGLPDPVAMAVALDPGVCTDRRAHWVEVETASELTRGMTIVDERGVLNQPPNIDVCWSIDVARWKETLYRTLQRDPSA